MYINNLLKIIYSYKSSHKNVLLNVVYAFTIYYYYYLSTLECSMEINQSVVEKLSYKHITNIANSLYVLSQLSLQKKLQVLKLTEDIATGKVPSDEVTKVQQKIKTTLKSQQYFHAERQIIIHYLLENDVARFNKYVVIKGVAYGLIKLKKYSMYCIVNKKLINKFEASYVGDQFNELPLVSNDKLNSIITEKEALRIFKLYYNEVLRKIKKAKRQTKKLSTKSQNKPKDQVLGSSQSNNRNIIVIKRKKRFALDI